MSTTDARRSTLPESAVSDSLRAGSTSSVVAGGRPRLSGTNARGPAAMAVSGPMVGASVS